MCGITGFSYIQENTIYYESEIANTIASLKHRGPDGDGFLIQNNVALGHTRLSIIDLAGGAQPMQNIPGDLAITFNGEIYNYRELRSHLLTQGYPFKTQSDTEVILAAYAQWGVDCVQHLRGMFAFAIADYRNQTLFLARDHFGIKPLVYTYLDHRIAFASEIQALRALPWVNRQLSPDPQSIYEFLRYTYIAAPRTGFQQIRKLPPAHYLIFDLRQPECEPQAIRYWQPTFNPDYSLSEAEWQERFEATIQESVSAHLVADVPFGAFLSGGLDSTLVTSQMSQLLDCPVKTFTIGFNEASYDERPYAQIAADTLGTHHHERVLSASALELLPRLVRHYGEPFGDCSAVPTWHVSQLARSHVPMVLTGDGGDEFFAGYPRYYAWLNMTTPPQRSAWKQKLRNLATRILPDRYPPDPNRRTLELWANLASWVIDSTTLNTLWKDINHSINPYPEAMEATFRSSYSLERISQAQFIDIQTYMTGSILTKVDIASMMHGLECRTPFVDIEVAKLALSMPPELLVKPTSSSNGYGEWSGKLPTKKSLSHKFDSGFIYRSKQGFSIPLNDWLFSSPKVECQIKEQLLDFHNPLYQYITADGIETLLTQKLGWSIWNLLFLSEWLQNA